MRLDAAGMRFSTLHLEACIVHSAERVGAEALVSFDNSVILVKRFNRIHDSLGGNAQPPPVLNWSGARGTARRLATDVNAIATLTTRVISGQLVANTIAGRGWQLAIAHVLAARALLDHALLAASNVERCARIENDALHARMRREVADGVEPPRRDIGGLETKYRKIHAFLSSLEERALADVLAELDACILREDRPLKVLQLLKRLPTSPGYVSESVRAARQAELRVLDETREF